MNVSTQTHGEPAPDTQHPRPDREINPSTAPAEAASLSEASPESAEQTEGADPSPSEATKTRRPRGFAAMDRSLVSAIARKGGKAAHEAGTAHEFTREEAREAGRKGGQATHAKRRAKQDTQQ